MSFFQRYLFTDLVFRISRALCSGFSMGTANPAIATTYGLMQLAIIGC
ncbi:MAG: hypothetical protein V7K67_17005 [Nostoc sp.]